MNLPGDRSIAASENPKSIASTWVFALLWCGISFPLFYVFAFQAQSWAGGAIGGLFSVFGIFMLWTAFRMTLDYAKFGEIRLTLHGGAARAGGTLSGLVEFTTRVPDSAAIDAELECKRVTWSRGSKGGPSMSEESAWKLPKSVPLRRTATGAIAAIALDIPASAMPSDLPGDEPGGSGLIAYRSDIELGRQYYRWELRIAADVPGFDLERSFRVKVEPASVMSGAADLLPMRTQPALRADTAVKAEIETRDARSNAARRRLSMWCGFVASLPFLAAFGTAGIAFGLAKCPTPWRLGESPACEWAGINWGPLVTGGIDLLFYAVPAGIAAAALLWVGGNLWLSRDDPAPSDGGMKRWGVAFPVLVFVVFMVLNIVDTGVLTRLFRSTDASRPAQTANAPQPPAPQPVAWTTPTGGWDMRMPEYAKYAGIAARGIQLAAEGNGLQVTFDRIAIEKNPAEAEVEHAGLAVRVRHQRRQGGMSGVASEQLPGKLTADNPVLALENHSFTIAGATVCLQEPCDFYLELDVRAPGQSIQIQTSRTARARGAR